MNWLLILLFCAASAVFDYLATAVTYRYDRKAFFEYEGNLWLRSYVRKHGGAPATFLRVLVTMSYLGTVVVLLASSTLVLPTFGINGNDALAAGFLTISVAHILGGLSNIVTVAGLWTGRRMKEVGLL